ncbi:MAG: NAD(P)H-dependent oxidoreductase subunit E [Nocardioides sp.]
MTASGTPDRREVVRSIADHHRHQRGPLLPILHEVVQEFGYVDRGDIEVIANALNLSVAEVHGVVSFYHDFRTTPPARHALMLCRAEACQAVGATALLERTRERAARGELGDDVEVGEVFCLGNCALGPAGMVEDKLHGRLTDDRIDVITKGWRA